MESNDVSKINRRRKLLDRSGRALLLTAVFCGGIAADRTFGGPGAGVTAQSSELTSSAAFGTLEDTWNLIHDQWADPGSFSDEELIYGAAAGMVDALGDEGHSRFMSPSETTEFNTDSEGEFVGIGVEVDLRQEQPVVVAPIDGSPAAAAGIRAGDIIIKVNDTETRRLDLDEITGMLRGKEGDPVTITVLSKGEPTPREVTIVRQKISVPPVSWRLLPGDIAQVRISDFSVSTARELGVALDDARAAGALGVVLDLRDNPGGLVSEAIGVASQFMTEGKTVFQDQTRDGVANSVKTVGDNGRWLDLPLAVLVNNGSASAAEIVGASLSDNDRGVLLGETTFGTGTVLSPFTQPDGSTVLLGTSLWLTADGDQIWKQGVEPDREVPQPLTATSSRPQDDEDVTSVEWATLDDVQLRAAVNLLRGEAGPAPVKPDLVTVETDS